MADTFTIVKQHNTVIPSWMLYDSSIKDLDIRLWGIFAAGDATTDLSYPKIAEHFAISVSTIQRSIRRLKDANALSVVADNGKPNKYILWPLNVTTPVTGDLGTPVTGDTPVTDDRGTRAPVSNDINTYNNINTNIINNSMDFPEESPTVTTRKKNEYDDVFNSLWKKYPRKANKPGAYKRYVATLKSGVDYTALLSAVVNYAKLRDGENEQYTLHGSTFFGPDERWRDYADEPIDPAEQEYNMISATIYDEWDAQGCWTDPDSGEDCYQSPSIHGYNRPRGADNAFMASDGSLYDIDASGHRVAPGYWNSN